MTELKEDLLEGRLEIKGLRLVKRALDKLKKQMPKRLEEAIMIELKVGPKRRARIRGRKKRR
jgi:hypothetical protein